jgi:hypothetical protein
MKALLTLLRKIGLSRAAPAGQSEPQSAFDRRLKMVNRARVVNAAGLGGPVFKTRSSR